MTKRVNDDDLIEISGGGDSYHIVPEPGGGGFDPRARNDATTPGGQPGPDKDAASGGSDSMVKK